MEVFVRGIPERATENQLSKCFRPILAELGILDWDCQKRKGKSFGFLIFLKVQDAEKFLDHHGQISNIRSHGNLPAGRTNILFNGIALSCTRSTKSPDQWALKNLQLQSKDRLKKAAKPSEGQSTPAVTPGPQSELPIHSISCGRWEYQASQPIFVVYRKWKIKGTIKFTSKRAIIKTEKSQRIDVLSSIVHELVLSGVPDPSITFTLQDAPMFFRVGPNHHQNNAAPGATTNFINTFQNMRLQNRQATANRTRLPSLDPEHGMIMGSCLVYQVGLTQVNVTSQLHALGHAHSLGPPIRQNVIVQFAEKSFQSEMAQLLKALEAPPLPFSIKFQVQRLAHGGYLSPKSILALLPEIRNLLSRCNLQTCVAIIRRLFNQLPHRCFEAASADFAIDSLTKFILDNEIRVKNGEIDYRERIASENIAYIHKVSITPSRIYLTGPDPENNNRVLRKYPNHHDHFIRVQFCEEDGDQLRYNAQISNDEIFQGRFKKILNDGFSIAGLHFSFLGFSHSSLRAQSCWFMAPFYYNGDLLFDRMLIKGLGDFSRIRCPAKCAARIGQAFSETPTAVTIAPGVAKVIPDVERNGRVFSDGVGTVSKGVLNKIWSRLSATTPRKVNPVVFQIRYGGAKGMIALDSRLPGDALRLRHSMIKFPGSDSLDIEICNDASRPLPYFLNHQSIKILEDMGVNEQFFLYHQELEVRRLRSTTSSPKLASDFLKRHAIGDRISLPWFVRQLDALGLSFHDEPFLRDVIETAVLIELRSLKYKARIPVEGGYTLLGIMDETGFLKEGEIFCIVEKAGKPYVIVKQNVLVSRSPALHPGDIQLVNAVNVPDKSPLLQLRNCVCFSQQGPRDLPSKLSGGDLDGDLYQVLFDSRAKPKRVFKPADYPRPHPIDLGREVVREDMTDFFITFMATDQLGRIANNHKILADQEPAGTLHGDCLTLAEMHSTAVDFSKSGVPVDLKLMPKFPPYRPDFMRLGPHITVLKNKPLTFSAPERVEIDDEEDTPAYKYYESDKILGKLFRAIDEREIFADIEKTRKPRTTGKSILDVILNYIRENCSYSLLGRHIGRARGIRAEYEECVRNISWEFSPEISRPLSEQEVFIGNILGKTGAQNKRQHDLSVGMKEQFNSDLAYIVDCIVKDHGEENNDNLLRCAACFLAGIEDLGAGSTAKSSEKPLVSFLYVSTALLWKEIKRLESIPTVRVGTLMVSV